MASEELSARVIGCASGIVLTFLGGIICLCMWGCPQYEVYKQGKHGEAKLKEAESSRQIATQEAHAKMESSKLLAQAEIERAKGVAEANRIIGEGLKNNHEYLTWLWLHGLAENQNAHTIIYVPTEANLPLLEAGRLLDVTKGRKAPAKP